MIIQSIGFGPDEVEITYLEDPAEKTGVVELRTLIVQKSVVPENVYTDLIDSAEQFVDESLLARRSPPHSFRGPR